MRDIQFWVRPNPDGQISSGKTVALQTPDEFNGVFCGISEGCLPCGGPYREALSVDGIPSASFAVDDVPKEVERLKALGVNFTQEALQTGPATTAVLDDTCGNLIQIASHA